MVKRIGLIINAEAAEKLAEPSFHTYRDGSMAQYTTREAMHEGEAHLIAPVVLMVEGVHAGSGGPILYTQEELSRFAAHWNGVPVPVLHPTTEDGTPISANSPETIERYNVGRLFNVHWDDATSKLRGEIWVNIRKALAVDPIVLATLQTGGALEVSTGLFSEEEHVGGTWNGETYNSIARNLRADHLALLPGQTGACSIADGCGVRANEQGGTSMKKVIVTQKQESGDVVIHRLLKSNAERGHLEVARLIQGALDGMDNAVSIHYLDEVFANSIVYHVRPGEQAQNQEVKHYRRGYSVNDDGAIEFDDEVTEVVQQTEFVAVTGNEQQGTTDTPDDIDTDTDTLTENEEDPMARKELIDSLRANASVNWAETEDVRLLALGCEDFAVELSTNMSAVMTANTEAAAAAAELETDTNEEEDLTGNEDQTLDEFVATAPAHLQGDLASAMKANSDARTAAITAIKANATNKFTDEQLKTFSDEQLQGIAGLASPGGNFGLRQTGVETEITGNSVEEPLELPGMVGAK